MVGGLAGLAAPRTAGAVWYSTAPLGPDRACISSTPFMRTTHGPLLRDLRQGIDGRLQPAVVGHEPRSSPPSDATQSSAARDHREGHARAGTRLHALPPDPAQGRQIAPGRPLTARS